MPKSFCPGGEMADALASGVSVGNDVGVQISPWAQIGK